MVAAVPRRGPFALVFMLSLAAVGLALATQHLWDMQPCPWCVLQRLVFVLVAAAALLGLAWPSRAGAWTAVLSISVLATLGAAAALWQHFVAAASASCNLTLADRIMSGLQLDALLPGVFAATASCADAKVNLLGVPYEFWSLGLFVVLDTIALAAVLRRPG
jgi:protein dithiol:quinone oxidoreductase